MKVFILAAGIGTRISRIAQGKPKCLLEMGEGTLIRQMVARLRDHGLTDITLITGYKHELIERELGALVAYRHNPFFHVTNSIASLWFARDLLDGDVLITNGDLFYEDRLLDTILADRRDVVMLADTTRIQGADYRFQFDGDRIAGYGKEIPDEETHGEYVGIASVRAGFVPKFKRRLEDLVAGQETGKWWEDVLYSFIPEGVPIRYRDVAGTFWAEVDYVEDYERILEWIARRRPGSK
ncbi:MAG TPA: phosphocholine cytidylyltransferase family protein [Phycisphaerae bacterium]|nr:phosphocholine cytidylyltransferase family protein [Phycisphaerae bacterium]